MAKSVSNSPVDIASHSNFGVDFVIRYKVADTTKHQTETQYVRLIEALHGVGLKTEVRYGSPTFILIFIKLSSLQDLEMRIYRSRLQDWLFDVQNAAPPQDMRRNLQENPITEAERLRLVHSLITSPKKEGGVGLTPKSGEWNCVEVIFPLHDSAFNQKWVKKLSSKYFLDAENLYYIKDHFGERISFYFAFLHSYFLFLTFPAGFGFCAWLFLGQYSPIYALLNSLWCIIFVEYWKKQHKQLTVQWESKDEYEIQYQRSIFRHDRTINDPLTGEKIQIFPPLKRLLRQLLQIPFTIGAIIALGGLIATCFGIEIFISEIYDGPFKRYLVLLPTIILSIVMPAISALLTNIASKLTDFENYETRDSHEASMIKKIFVLNFITSYLPIYLTAFVYVPFGQILVPYLNFFHIFVEKFSKSENQIVPRSKKFQINPDRLTSQVIYYTVTAQIINFGLECIVPFAKRKVFSKFSEVQASRSTKRDSKLVKTYDSADEAEFLTKVRNEANMKEYDVNSDFREIVIQFGYLSLFSAVWPLTAISFLINDWVEIRGDAMKITMETQRSVPLRADSIRPWLDALDFLTWLGCMTSSALVYLFNGNRLNLDGTPWNVKGWSLLLTIFLCENLYLATRIVVRKLLHNFYSLRDWEKTTKILKTRQSYLMETLSKETANGASQQQMDTVMNTNSCRIGDDAINFEPESSGHLKHQFWQDQRSLIETIKIGKDFILTAKLSETKKDQ